MKRLIETKNLSTFRYTIDTILASHKIFSSKFIFNLAVYHFDFNANKKLRKTAKFSGIGFLSIFGRKTLWKLKKIIPFFMGFYIKLWNKSCVMMYGMARKKPVRSSGTSRFWANLNGKSNCNIVSAKQLNFTLNCHRKKNSSFLKRYKMKKAALECSTTWFEIIFNF